MNRTNRIVMISAFVLVGVCAGRAFAGVPGDISKDNEVNAVDVQLVINAVLTIDIGDLNADINSDFMIDAVDVQLVINAALGLSIKVPVEIVPKQTDFSVIDIHDPMSDAYDQNCMECHGDRLGELSAHDPDTPSVHAELDPTMSALLGSGNTRCNSCHTNGADLVFGTTTRLKADSFDGAGCATSVCHGATGPAPYYAVDQ
jgi:hypothetical protein